MAFRVRDDHAMEKARAFPSDAITTLGNNKAASLLLLSFGKVSNTKDMLTGQTCQGLLCVST